MVGIFIFSKIPRRKTLTSANLYYDKDSRRKKKGEGGRGDMHFGLVWYFGGFHSKD